MLDICILIGIAVLALFANGLATLMALHPPDPKARNAGYITAFVVLGILTLALTSWGLVRSYNAHERELKLTLGDEKVPPPCGRSGFAGSLDSCSVQ